MFLFNWAKEREIKATFNQLLRDWKRNPKKIEEYIINTVTNLDDDEFCVLQSVLEDHDTWVEDLPIRLKVLLRDLKLI
jgi:hypothetical protein